MGSSHKIRQFHLRTVYRNGWDILSTWTRCECSPGNCPLERELARLGTTPADLLEALVLGNPAVLGIEPTR